MLIEEEKPNLGFKVNFKKERTRMTFVTKLSLAGMLAMSMAYNAQALSITPADASQFGNQTSQSLIDAAIAPTIGSATELYKSNVGGVEEKALASSYATAYLDSPMDPSGATITYTGGLTVGPTAWMLVKDGQSNPAWYLFNLTALGWNGTATLDLSAFWVGQGQLGNGSISHIALYGGSGGTGTTSVPDGGITLAFLGLALGSLGFARRKLKG